MGCAEKDCCTKGAATGAIAFPGTNEPNTPWKLYNHLIAGIPEDVGVRDYCLGTHWSYVEADSGMGVSFTTTGGARRGYTGDLRGMSLREVAELSKSWCFEEASLGVAALNAWYSQRRCWIRWAALTTQRWRYPTALFARWTLSKCIARRSALPVETRAWLSWGISPMWNASRSTRA